MSDFKVYVDGQIFYHPNLSKLAILEAKATEDAERIDSFILSAPYNHPYIDSIIPMASVILCKKGEKTVFEGRAIDDGSDFYNTHTWHCESALSYLKDTIQPPFEYKGTLRGLFDLFIDVHNKSVETQKKFKIGEITVTDNNDYVAYSSSEYLITSDAIRNKLINTHGGYLAIRYEDDGKYLDYLADFNMKSLQKVEYGKNITDVKIKQDHTERFTALIPLGARVNIVTEEGVETETSERVNIKDVNDGKNYIYDEKAVEEIGWIWTTEVWDDVTIPGNLLTKANARLSDLVKGVTSIELTIIDESDAGMDIGAIHARMYLDCVSKHHGINGTYLCIARTRDYLNPSGNTIAIGASGVSLSKTSVKQEKNITNLENDLIGQSEVIQNVDSKVDDAVKNAELLKEEIHECYSEIAKTADEITSIVHDTFIEKSELETIQSDFQSAITQNSSEIRFDFTTITDEIKGDIAYNKELLAEYIRFKGALIELGKVGNAFTAELSNEELAFKENGQKIAYISNNSLVITNAEIRNKLSLGNVSRGWFDFLPRVSGNLSIKWRSPSA